MSVIEPEGIRFPNILAGHLVREYIFVTSGYYIGWLCWRHPDGQWVTSRKATSEDIDKLKQTGYLSAEREPEARAAIARSATDTVGETGAQ